MREYQERICDAVTRKTNWSGSNVVVKTENNITKVYYHGNQIARVDHSNKSATFDNCGYTNAATTARINAVKEACNSLVYNY